MQRTRAFAWTMVGACTVSVFGCSATPTAEVREERIGTKQQRLAGAQKICQLIGDRDYQTGIATKSLSWTNARVKGTDLGYPVHDTTRNRVWFLFGDMFPSDGGSGVHAAPDPLGYTGAVLPGDECPTLDFEKIPQTDPPRPPEFKPMTLVGHSLGGFAVPTGATYDASEDRILAGFMWPSSSSAPNTSVLGWAAAQTPTAFTPFVDGGAGEIPGDPSHFLQMAPSIVDASAVTNPSALPGASENVLLVFGTGTPYRKSAVYLAAVRLDQVSVRSSWRFFIGGPNPWSTSSLIAQPLFPEKPPAGNTDPFATGCAGEISVTYNSVFRKWMMTYHCPQTDVAGRPPADGAVILRMAEKPEGPWSAAIQLFVPKKNNQPADGDPAFGAFIHHGNLRMKRSSSLGPLQLLTNEPTDPYGPSPLPTTCVPNGGFPAYCGAPVNHNPNGFPGNCCTNPNRCCDGMFDSIKLSSTDGMASWRDGGVYAPYIVQPWSRALDGSATTPATKQKLYYVVSTWNPYTVVLMSNELTNEDVDNDGVDDAHDNCPAAFNPGQENCNEAAEDAWNVRHANKPLLQVPKLGDACDPVPCPAKAFNKVTQQIQTGNCSTDPWTPSFCSGRSIRELMDVTPVGASPRTEYTLASEAPLPRNLTVSDVPTHSRFCQNRPPDFRCADELKMSDDELNAFSHSPEEEALDDQHIWHRVKLYRSCPPNGIGCLLPDVPRGDPFTMSYGPDRRRYLWEYQADNTFWQSRAIIPANPDATCQNSSGLFGAGTCLAGRFWTHGATSIGKDGVDGHDYVGTIHVGAHGEQLANHFIEAIPDRPFAWIQGGLLTRPLFFIRLTLPDPAPTWKLSPGSVLPIVVEDGQYNAVFDDGHREGITEVFSTAAQAAIANTGFTWLSAEEASPRAGKATRPLGVALERGVDSMMLSETLMDVGGGLVDVGGAPQIMSGAAPRARTDYVSIYSRARGRVFLAGGTDFSTGVPLTDIWSFELDRQAWKRIPRVSAELFEIKAMTYSYRDGHLWVIDRDARDPSLVSWRLLRIDPTTGSWEVLHATQPSAVPPSYADLRTLGVDLNGNVVLTVSNASPQRHRVALITTRAGGYDVAATSCRQRALATPALPDLNGYAFYFKQDAELDMTCVDEGQPPLLVPTERLESLPLHGATLSTLEELLR